jgi:putative ABC transport system substrate-binding protein
VDSIRQPGGNVTGVQTGNTIPKALEWLLKIVPGTTKVYTPYHSEDGISITSIALLHEAAATLGVELVPGEVRTQEELIAAIKTLPGDAAIFLVPAPRFESRISDIIKVATERGIATGTYQSVFFEKGASVCYGGDLFSTGEQAARLVDQVLKGTAPADLPVETAEGFLSINLQTAEAVDFDIPDEILRQADTVIR